MSSKKQAQYDSEREARSASPDLSKPNKTPRPAVKINMVSVVLYPTIATCLLIAIMLIRDSSTADQPSKADVAVSNPAPPITQATFVGDLPEIGTLKKVSYLWSEGHYRSGGGVYAHNDYVQPRITTSILHMHDGTTLLARGHVPDFAYGATVHQRDTDHDVMSDYCIGPPLNDCFAPDGTHNPIIFGNPDVTL
jgi:hypothetical protein